MKGARALLAVIALAGITVAAAPGSSLGATAPGGETLTLQPDCANNPPPYHWVLITLSGFQPHTDVTGTVSFPDGGGVGPTTVQTDDNGRFSISLGSSAPGTVTANVQWSGGTLSESVYVNCPGANGALVIRPPGSPFFQQVGYFSAPLRFTVVNHGPAVVSVDRARLAGRHPDEFLIASDSCSGADLGVGGRCFVRVRFGPAVLGGRRAALELTSSAAAAPFRVSLFGTGLPRIPTGPRRPMAGSVHPAKVRAGARRCFDFQARRRAGPLEGALVRFAGEEVLTGDDGSATLCKRFRYPGTRTARLWKRGYRSVLLLISVKPR